MSDFKPGLEGVIAFETEIAEPDRAGGALRYRGVDIEDLIGQVSFGNVWGLLVDGRFGPGLPRKLPSASKTLAQNDVRCATWSAQSCTRSANTGPSKGSCGTRA